MRLPRRSRTQQLEGPDGIRSVEWASIVDMVEAAAHPNPDVYKSTMDRLRRIELNDILLRVYLYFALVVAVGDELGPTPKPEALLALADRVYPHWARIIDYDRTTLNTALLTSFDEDVEAIDVLPGAKRAIASVVILGSILKQPRQDLIGIRSSVARAIEAVPGLLDGV